MVFAPFHAGCDAAFHLFRQIPAVHFINEVFKGNVHAPGLSGKFPAVIAVVNADEADAQKGENLLQIVPHFKVIAAEAGEVFDYDAVYFPLSGQLKHFLHRRPLEICTGVSVVHEFSDFRIPKFLFLLQVGHDVISLVGDAEALVFFTRA